MKLLLPWKLKTNKISNSSLGIEFEEYKIIDSKGNVVLDIMDKALGEEIVNRINKEGDYE